MNDRRKVLKQFEEQKNSLDEKIAEDIEKYRKGNAEIVVTDKNGNIIPNAKISIKQKSHEFRFGANLFLLDEMETDEKNAEYKKYFADVFNMATLPFYWDSTEPQRGNLRYNKDSTPLYRRPTIDLCMEFCEKHGIEPREHALAYELRFPKWLKGASTDEVKSELRRRYGEIGKRYANSIETIEVTNEMLWNNGVTDFYFDPDYVRWCFELAEEFFPDNKLVINEATNESWRELTPESNPYYRYIKANMEKGARIDAIGMQYHMFYRKEDEAKVAEALYSPQNLYKIMDMMNSFDKPLQITEITIPAYSNSVEDEAIQAEIIEWLYKIWFSCPTVEQIIYWNLVDGYCHVEDATPEKIRETQGNMTLGENYYYGGLIRFDMTPKPAYYKIKELTQNTWHTETKATTDENGVATFRGFYGQYEVEISAGDKTVTRTINLSSKSDNKMSVTL